MFILALAPPGFCFGRVKSRRMVLVSNVSIAPRVDLLLEGRIPSGVEEHLQDSQHNIQNTVVSGW